MSRTRRLISGVGLTYLNMGLTTLVGLWLTRFVLRTVGQHDYGLWLVMLQLTSYLSMLDLGVVALLPRDIALIAAREEHGGAPGQLAEHVGSTLRLVLWQLPLVALAALVLMVAVPSGLAVVRAPLMVILIAYVFAFPVRTFQAVLTGLQDLGFVGAASMVSWAVGTTLTVVLLLAGHGLSALAVAWTVTQLGTPLACLVRFGKQFPKARPKALPHLDWSATRSQLMRSLWVSVGQISHVLVNASDVLVIGAVLGPAAVVPYVITGKLMAVLTNVPISIATSATPALSDLHVREAPTRVMFALSALTQTVILVSGAMACGILAVNQEFVRLWVGTAQFGGMRLTVAIVAAAVIRHWILTLGMAAFSFGYERRLGIVSIVESALCVGLMVLLVRTMGPIGAPVASLLSALVVSLPATLGAVAEATKVKVFALLKTVAPWGWRVLATGTIAAVALRPWAMRGLLPMVVAGTAAVLLYGFAMLPLVLRPPLKGYLVRFKLGWLEKLAPAS
ncbi:MAG: lipopolysaccharide biosynthesis protein [Gemmatimonadales bacterium]